MKLLLVLILLCSCHNEPPSMQDKTARPQVIRLPDLYNYFDPVYQEI